MKAGRQTTLGARATVSGIGVHSGQPVSITFHPADAGTGIVFVRLDAHGRQAPVSSNQMDDDQLEIPAFLRRQAN